MGHFCLGYNIIRLLGHLQVSAHLVNFKDVPGGIPKSDLLGVTVALIHVAGQRCLAV